MTASYLRKNANRLATAEPWEIAESYGKVERYS